MALVFLQVLGAEGHDRHYCLVPNTGYWFVPNRQRFHQLPGAVFCTITANVNPVQKANNALVLLSNSSGPLKGSWRPRTAQTTL